MISPATSTDRILADSLDVQAQSSSFSGAQMGHTSAQMETLSSSARERQPRESQGSINAAGDLHTKIRSLLTSFSWNCFSIKPSEWRTLRSLLTPPRLAADNYEQDYKQAFDKMWSDIRNLVRNNTSAKTLLLEKLMQTQACLIQENPDFVEGYNWFLRQNEQSVLTTGKFFQHRAIDDFFPTSDLEPFQTINYEDRERHQEKALKAYCALLLNLLEGNVIDYSVLGMVFAHIDMAFSVYNEATKTISETTMVDSLSQIRTQEGRTDEVRSLESRLDSLTGENNFGTFNKFSQHTLYQFVGGCSTRNEGFCHLLSYRFLESLAEIEQLTGVSDDDKSNLKVLAIQRFKQTLRTLEDTAIRSPVNILGITEHLFIQNDRHDEENRFAFNNIFNPFSQNKLDTLADKIAKGNIRECYLRLSSDFIGSDAHVVAISTLNIGGKKVFACFDVNVGLVLLHSKEELKAFLTKSCEIITPKKELEKCGIKNYRFQVVEISPKRLAKIKASESDRFLSLAQLENACLKNEFISPITLQERYDQQRQIDRFGKKALPKIATKPISLSGSFDNANGFEDFRHWRKAMLEAAEKEQKLADNISLASLDVRL